MYDGSINVAFSSYSGRVLVWMMRNPSYRYLFGGVSVNSLYSPISRAVIASSLVKEEYKPRPNEKRKSLKLSKEAQTLCYKLQNRQSRTFPLIKQLEADDKDIPPLAQALHENGRSVFFILH